MGLFRTKAPTPAEPAEATPDEPEALDSAGDQRKNSPTPTRKQAERERRERRNPPLSKKERKQRERQAISRERSKIVEMREKEPERALLRDYIDARFNIGEFLLPVLALMLALTFLSQVWPMAPLVSTIGLYGYIALTIIDTFLMWRGFKKVLEERHPKASPKGLLGNAFNRSIQIRRFRNPAPRLKRGGTY